MDFETRAIHEGHEPDPATGSLTTPIYQTSTYVQEEVGKHKGYDYSRVSNPTRTALETCLASLESADHGVAFSSGLGAVMTLMHLVSPGEHVVSVNDVYGGVYRMFSQVYEPKGYRFTFLSAEQISGAELRDHLDEQTRIVWLKTPAVRMERHCENARRVAAFLDGHAAVERVLYPGLASHPGHDIAVRQMSDFGGMISFLAGSEEDAVRLVAETKIWKLAESLGGVESLIEHPARMTHASTADAPFATPRNLVRLSVGIESADDLIADLAQALVGAEAAAKSY